MKAFVGLILAALVPSMVVAADFCQDPQNENSQALFVSYFGGISGFDQEGYQQLRMTFGKLVADGTLGIFETREIGKSGGGAFCIQLDPASTRSLAELKDLVLAHQPRSSDTYFNVRELITCLKEQAK